MPTPIDDPLRGFPPPATTEHAFRIGAMRPVGATVDAGVVGSMTTGAWARRAGAPCAGVLAVLLDAVLARAGLLGTGPGLRWITSELSIDLCAPLPDGVEISAEARRRHTGPVEIVADAQARAGGDLLAVATTRGRLLPAQTWPDLGPARLFDSLDDLTTGTEEPGVLRVHPHPGVTNQQGLLHGGVAACVADIAAQQAFDRQHPLRTSAIRVVYLRPLPLIDGPVTARTTLIHQGRSLRLTRVELVRPDGRTGAVATVTASA